MIKDPVIQGCVNLATDVLDNFDDAWIGLVISYADEKEFNNLRKFFNDYKYQIYCDLCDIDAKSWQNSLENIKTMAFDDKNYYETIKKQYDKKHNTNKESVANG